METRCETPVQNIHSSDEEFFDEKVWFQANSGQKLPKAIIVPQPTPYPSEGQDRDEQLLETRLAAITKAHLAYSEQANLFTDTCFEILRQKKNVISRLQRENQRLQHAQQQNGVGHNPGGTGESPSALSRQALHKKSEARVAWNLSESPRNGLREAASEVAHTGQSIAAAEKPPLSPVSIVKLSQVEPLDGQRRQSNNSVATANTIFTIDDPTSLESVKKLSPSRHTKRQGLVVARQHKTLMSGSGPSSSHLDLGGPRGSHAVFIDAAAMKEKVREAIMQPDYNVVNFYSKLGFCQSLARNPWFENVTLAIIAFNALWIAVDTDFNKAATLIVAHPVFIVADNFFCLYFFVEVLIRFLAFQNKRDCMKDTWFVFDSSLVLMMVMETWVMSIVLILTKQGSNAGLSNASILRMVRLLRLTRMARMARLLRAMPELMILIKGISVAIRSVFFTLFLLTIIIYIFGVAFAQLSEGTPLAELYFKNVPKSMSTLLLRGVLPDLYNFVTRVGEENHAFAVFLLLFILMSSLTVMNMLMGVLVEVVSVVSSVEREQMTVQFVKTMLLAMMNESDLDADGDNYISKTEFESLLMKPEAARIIQEVGVDVVGLVDLAEFIFTDCGDQKLSFAEFMEVVLALRGTNTATVKDIVDLRRYVSTQLGSAIEHITSAVSSTVDQSMKLGFLPPNDDRISRGSALSTVSEISHCSTPPVAETAPIHQTIHSEKGNLGEAKSHRPLCNGLNTPDDNCESRPVTGYGSISSDASIDRSQSLIRPLSGMSIASVYRPQSGVRNSLPLPSFPDSMWRMERDIKTPPADNHMNL